MRTVYFIKLNTFYQTKEKKYVGDVITEDGKNDQNIAARKARAFAIAGDILAILEEVPLGPYRIDAGLCMRNAMFLNAILTNSETWYGITSSHVLELQEVDEYLLRKILKAHSKTQKEMLHLETATVPIKYIIKSQRLSYLHNILNRKKSELISKIFYAQKRRPVKDDWAETIKKDIEDIELNLSEENIRLMKKGKFKNILKKKIHQAAFKDLQNKKLFHSKVDHIIYSDFKVQKYVKSYLFRTDEKQLLFKLRTRMTNSKSNFKSMHGKIDYNLCDKNLPQTDSHLLDCTAILENCPNLARDSVSEYEDIFGNLEKQLKITKLFKEVFEAKQNIDEEISSN